MKLRVKISIFLSVLLVVALLVQAYLFHHFFQRALLDKAQFWQGKMAESLSEKINIQLKEAQANLLNISNFLGARSLLFSDSQVVEKNLKSAYTSGSLFDNDLFILDRQGKGIAAFPPVPFFKGEQFAARDYFQETQKERKPVISSPYVSKRNRAVVITFTTPLLSLEGEFLGLLGGSMNIMQDNLLGRLKEIRIGETGRILIFDNKGRIILQTNPTVSFSESPYFARDYIGKDIPLDSRGLIPFRSKEGIPFHLALKRLPATGWTLGIIWGDKEMLAPLNVLERQITFTLVMGLIMALLLGIWGTEIVVKPLQILSRSIRNFKGGNWEAPRELLKRPDEIGDLVISFQDMSQKLGVMIDSLDFLRSFSEELNRSLDLEGVLDKAVTLAAAKTEADMTAITLLDERRGIVEYLVRRGHTPEYIQAHPHFRIGEGATGSVVQTGEPLILPEYPESPFATSESVELGKLRSLAVFPLKIQTRTIGTLNIGCTKFYDFPKDEINLYQSITPIIASALNNAKIHQEIQTLNKELEDLSRLDGLTGVFNRRYLEERLAGEIDRCERLGGSLGLLMIDLDDFKGINDAFGHDIGDEALKEVARVLQENCRKIDVVGRYGGDEFLLILVQTSEPTAQKIAERIRQRALEIQIRNFAGKISLSIGVAAGSQDYPEILRQADNRRYDEKKAHAISRASQPLAGN
jgi:diguanylate cyclase (GGDEF)-like protein